MKAPPSVLIIAPENDPHACVVTKRLEALGARAVIVDSANFPSQWQVSVRTANEEPLRFTIGRNELELDENDVVGVWWRRPRRPVPSVEIRESHLRRFVALESRAEFEGWLHCLGDRVINPVAADHAASHKLLQLRCAADVGLTIPKSLATNSPTHARDFIETNRAGTIYKPFTATRWRLIGTQRLSADALDHLDAVTYSPVIFQEEIHKAAEVRVNMLDGQAFAVTIRSQHRDGLVDWRIAPTHEYSPHVLPATIEARLVALMANLGLRFAACDLALTEDGDYVFFEANSGGQWLFAEIMTGQEISWAFAEALLGGNRSSRP